MSNTLYRYIEGNNETGEDEDIFAELEAIENENVPRLTEDGYGKDNVLEMRQGEESSWSEILPGLSRSVYEDLAEITPNDLDAEEKGQLQELRRRISEAGQNTEEAMREVWGAELSDAPPRLRKAITGGMAMQEMSPSDTATDIFDELNAIENETEDYGDERLYETAARKTKDWYDETDLSGGAKVFASQLPSMVTDVIPETIGRAIRRGDETIDEDALDKWIRVNAEERERAKTLTPEEREETWFRVPFTDVKVTKGDAESAADSIGYSLVNAGATFGAKALTTLVLAPVLTPIGSAIASIGSGFVAGTAISQGATKDQFVEMVKDEWEMAHAGEQMTPELQQQWHDIYKEIESDANWYGFWEAAPETAGNLLTLGIAKLPIGKALGPALNKLKGNVVGGIGTQVAKMVGIPALKLASMLTEESVTEMVTQKKQADIEYENGLRDRPISYAEALKEVLPMVITTTPFMGGSIGIATKLAEKMNQQEKEDFDELEVVEEGKPTKKPKKEDPFSKIFSGIKKEYEAGRLQDKDIEDIKSHIQEKPGSEQVVESLDKILTDGKKVRETAMEEAEAAKFEPEEQKMLVSAIESVGTRVFGETFEPGKVKIAPETEETKNVRTVATALNLGNINFFDAGGTQLVDINGFYDTATKQIYLNKDTRRPLLVVMGHESLHKLKKDEPSLYGDLKSILKGKELGFDEYVTKLNAKRVDAGVDMVDVEKAYEEFVADFVGTSMTKPSFWKKLHEQDPTITRKLAEVLTELINKIRKTLTGRDAKKYFKDLDALETEVAKVYAKYAKVSDRRWIDSEYKGEEKRVSQRRADEIQRKKIDEMTEEEKGIALKYHELTGLLSKRAYNESKKKPIQVSIDVDALKWVNDTFGHDEGGNELLKIVAKALSQTWIDAYHISGDEFYLQADSMAEAGQAVKKAVEYLENNPLTLTYQDGTKTKYKAGFSYGAGKDITEAEKGLQKHKAERKLSKRGEKPARGLEEGTEGDKVGGREGGVGKKIIPPDNDQLIKIALDNDIKYTRKVKIGNRTVTGSKNAGDALSDVSEKRTILKRILDCAK